jgi:hypothetical protein
LGSRGVDASRRGALPAATMVELLIALTEVICLPCLDPAQGRLSTQLLANSMPIRRVGATGC